MQHCAGPDVSHGTNQRGRSRVRALADKGGVREAAEERAHAQPLFVLEQLQPKLPAPGRAD